MTYNLSSVHKNITFLNCYRHLFEDPIDKAIAPRPWFIVKKYIFKPNADHVNMIHHIIFEKFRYKVNKLIDNNIFTYL